MCVVGEGAPPNPGNYTFQGKKDNQDIVDTPENLKTLKSEHSTSATFHVFWNIGRRVNRNLKAKHKYDVVTFNVTEDDPN